MSWRSGRRDLPAKDPGGPPAKFLPPQLYALFRPRPPLERPSKTGKKRKMPPYTGIAAFVAQFEESDPPERVIQDTPKEKKQKRWDASQKSHATTLEKRIEEWEPATQKNTTGDAYKTLFVARLSFDVTEKKLKREYEKFGPIKTVKMVYDKEDNPRGYAFIEFEDDQDMLEAYKRGDGVKINGHRVLVDVERGRTVRNWRPRKLGGGLGSTRKGGKDQNRTASGRDGGGGGSSSSSSSSRSSSSRSYGSSSRSSGDRDRGSSSRSDRDRRSERSGDRRSDRRSDRSGGSDRRRRSSSRDRSRRR